MLNDLIALLMAIPMALAAKWAVWFAFGLALSIWGRREQNYVPSAYEHEASAKAKWGERPPRPAKVAAATASAAPSSDDPFADLEALFGSQEGTHRMPGEALAALPVKAEAPATSPVLAEAPRLAAPQSLP